MMTKIDTAGQNLTPQNEAIQAIIIGLEVNGELHDKDPLVGVEKGMLHLS